MKAIVTVIGKDRVGIIASVCGKLSQHNVNILDISQTILQDYFTMIMLVDTGSASKTLDEIAAVLHEKEVEMNLSIRIQREDIFHAMHRI